MSKTSAMSTIYKRNEIRGVLAQALREEAAHDGVGRVLSMELQETPEDPIVLVVHEARDQLQVVEGILVPVCIWGPCLHQRVLALPCIFGDRLDVVHQELQGCPDKTH